MAGAVRPRRAVSLLDMARIEIELSALLSSDAKALADSCSRQRIRKPSPFSLRSGARRAAAQPAAAARPGRTSGPYVRRMEQAVYAVGGVRSHDTADRNGRP